MPLLSKRKLSIVTKYLPYITIKLTFFLGLPLPLPLYRGVRGCPS